MTYNPDPDSEFENRLEAEDTLRLLAQLPPPESLTGRVHARVRHQMAGEQATARRRGFWSLWSTTHRLQFAGAAALAIAVAGSMWTLNRAHHADPVMPQAVVPAQQGSTPASGFSSAKAERVPATLNPIKVPPAPKKKPSPKGAAKPSAKVLAAQPAPAANQ